MKKVVGVGVYNDKSPTHKEVKTEGKRKVVWRCPYYSRWVDMLKRAYSKKALIKNPTYEKVTVCQEWLTFSNFKDWVIKQESIYGSVEGKHLDKDIIGNGFIYSPDSCAFVSRDINSFFAYIRSKKKSNLPPGVIKHINSVGRVYYLAKIQHPVGYKNLTKAKRVALKYCSTPEEAHYIWAKEKLAISHFVTRNCGNDKIISAVRDKLKTLVSEAESKLNRGKGKAK